MHVVGIFHYFYCEPILSLSASNYSLLNTCSYLFWRHESLLLCCLVRWCNDDVIQWQYSSWKMIPNLWMCSVCPVTSVNDSECCRITLRGFCCSQMPLLTWNSDKCCICFAWIWALVWPPGGASRLWLYCSCCCGVNGFSVWLCSFGLTKPCTSLTPIDSHAHLLRSLV